MDVVLARAFSEIGGVNILLDFINGIVVSEEGLAGKNLVGIHDAIDCLEVCASRLCAVMNSSTKGTCYSHGEGRSRSSRC